MYISGRRPTPPPINNGCGSSRNSFGLSFQPTQGTSRESGGQPGFPGSSFDMQCNEARGRILCAGFNMDW